MSSVGAPHRDERTLMIENESYRWAYLFMTFGALVLVMWRSLVHRQQSWDLIGLVVASGVLTTGYQWSRRTLTRRWLIVTVVSLGLAAVVAAMVAMTR